MIILCKGIQWKRQQEEKKNNWIQLVLRKKDCMSNGK